MQPVGVAVGLVAAQLAIRAARVGVRPAGPIANRVDGVPLEPDQTGELFDFLDGGIRLADGGILRLEVEQVLPVVGEPGAYSTSRT